VDTARLNEWLRGRFVNCTNRTFKRERGAFAAGRFVIGFGSSHTGRLTDLAESAVSIFRGFGREPMADWLCRERRPWMWAAVFEVGGDAGKLAEELDRLIWLEHARRTRSQLELLGQSEQQVVGWLTGKPRAARKPKPAPAGKKVRSGIGPSSLPPGPPPT
jgi:hypothetical protein